MWYLEDKSISTPTNFNVHVGNMVFYEQQEYALSCPMGLNEEQMAYI